MSKHQEYCCGCIYDDPDYEDSYCLECDECELPDESDTPTKYVEA